MEVALNWTQHGTVWGARVTQDAREQAWNASLQIQTAFENAVKAASHSKTTRTKSEKNSGIHSSLDNDVGSKRKARKGKSTDKDTEIQTEIPFAQRTGAPACSLTRRPTVLMSSQASGSKWLKFRNASQDEVEESSWCEYGTRYEMNSRGQRLYTQQWTPRSRKYRKSPRGSVFLVHGLNGHSSRFTALVRSFVEEGYAVFAHDLSGHGRSDGLRAYVAKIQNYVDDARTHTNAVFHRFPNLQEKPKFLVGHSMGGAVAIRLARDDENAVNGKRSWNGVMLTAPAVQVFPKPLLSFFAPILSTLLPFAPVQRLRSRNDKQTQSGGNFASLDPLILRMAVRARVGYELLRSCDDIKRSATRFTSALFIAHAKQDRVTDAKGSQMFIEKVASPDKTLRLYDSAAHDLLGCQGGIAEDVVTNMVRWATERS
uniref:Serine aminopeptidase S33 domain-containing protein n=1 Tax=Timspurckia oligopyrenoides TaxID=708627 RepID=A0A7S0ZJK7_9RHOD|mmetsp:Transcript_7815/g.14188  ORF Transcript_7815/g.14188 Transcript_7815/m.14188 type:complete len:428 (+) Transcript_7815:77-1360(+)